MPLFQGDSRNLVGIDDWRLDQPFRVICSTRLSWRRNRRSVALIKFGSLSVGPRVSQRVRNKVYGQLACHGIARVPRLHRKSRR
jgi:hypothetical protein